MMGRPEHDNVGNGCAWMVMIFVAMIAVTKCSRTDDIGRTASISDTAFVNANTLNCRASPNVSSPIVDQLYYGESVIIDDRQNDWGLVDREGTDCWASTDYFSSKLPTQSVEPNELQRFVAPVSPSIVSDPPRSCSAAPYCTEMSSCREAQFYYQECGVSRLDGDNDGVPCENLC